MKIWIKTILILFVITVFSVVTIMTVKYIDDITTLPDGFTVTAHSGSEGTTDNSVEFLKKAIELNVPVLEIDITFRRDGTPVVIHKDVAGDSEGMLLDDAIRYISENSETVRVNLDLKSVANLPAVIEILDNYGMRERCFYTGVELRFVDAVRSDGRLPYYLNYSFNKFKRNSRKEHERILAVVKDSGAIGLNCNQKLANRNLVAMFHENGLLVSYWTANSEKDMKKLLIIAPDNITTRYPVMLTELVNEKN